MCSPIVVSRSDGSFRRYCHGFVWLFLSLLLLVVDMFCNQCSCDHNCTIVGRVRVVLVSAAAGMTRTSIVRVICARLSTYMGGGRVRFASAPVLSSAAFL